MKLPGPDHPISVAANPRRVRAKANGHVIADSDRALILKEADLPPVVYFPRGDVETGFFSLTGKLTHCPYKGDASHYSMMIDGQLLENAAWSYRSPYPAMQAITDYIAFYPDQVEVYEVDEDALKHHRREPPGAAAGEALERGFLTP